MAKRKKGAVRQGHGVMCNICGLNCGKGGALAKHILGAHQIAYEDYRKCFYGEPKTILADGWDDSVSAGQGNVVVTHILVRRFMREPGDKRGATRTARRA